jgi:hypothetical protein
MTEWGRMARTLRVKRHVLKCAVLALLLLSTSASWAQLGQPVQDSARQFESLHLPKSETHAASGYSYNLLSSDDLVVKQYVNSGTDTVFGVTWKGKRMPSLQSLLGFDPYKISGPGVTRSLHTARIQTESLSVEIVALKGPYAGRAVRTDLLPQGVSASVVTP